MLYLIIFVVTFIWGLNGIIDRQALSTGHPIEVDFITTLTMTIVAMIYLATAKLWGFSFHFHRSTIGFSVLNGILIPTAYIIFLFALSRSELKKFLCCCSQRSDYRLQPYNFHSLFLSTMPY